jgi:hypothetical protein
MIRCAVTSAGSSAFAEVLGRNQCPTSLRYCEIDNCDLTDGLHGNNRLKSLNPRLSANNEHGNREVLAFADVLRENPVNVEYLATM